MHIIVHESCRLVCVLGAKRMGVREGGRGRERGGEGGREH